MTPGGYCLTPLTLPPAAAQILVSSEETRARVQHWHSRVNPQFVAGPAAADAPEAVGWMTQHAHPEGEDRSFRTAWNRNLRSAYAALTCALGM